MKRKSQRRARRGDRWHNPGRVSSFPPPNTSRASPAPSRASKPEQEIALLIADDPELGLAGLVPVTEYQFHPTRRWRFDFAWLAQRVALEVEGGVYLRGRHNRAPGFIADCEKYNEATLMGWTVLRVPVSKGWQDTALALLKRALGAK